MVLSEKLAALRKEHGYSQLNVAERLNVSRQAISRWEVGNSVPSTENLMELSRLYGVSLDELVGCDTGEKIPPTPESQTVYLEPASQQQKVGVKYRKRTFVLVAVMCLVFIFLLVDWLWNVNHSQDKNIVDLDHMQQEGIVAPDGDFDFNY